MQTSVDYMFKLIILMLLQYTFKYTYKDCNLPNIIEQYTRIITEVGIGTNLKNDTKFYPKGGILEVQQDTNEDKDEHVSFTFIKIKIFI